MDSHYLAWAQFEVRLFLRLLYAVQSIFDSAVWCPENEQENLDFHF